MITGIRVVAGTLMLGLFPCAKAQPLSEIYKSFVTPELAAAPEKKTYRTYTLIGPKDKRLALRVSWSVGFDARSNCLKIVEVKVERVESFADFTISKIRHAVTGGSAGCILDGGLNLEKEVRFQRVLLLCDWQTKSNGINYKSTADSLGTLRGDARLEPAVQ